MAEIAGEVLAESGSIAPVGVLVGLRRLAPSMAERWRSHRRSRRRSGRVGRSAAAGRLESRAIEAAVVASVRHVDTDYDEQLMAGVDREEARAVVREKVDRVLDGWRRPDAVRRSGRSGFGIGESGTGAAGEAAAHPDDPYGASRG